MKLDARTQMLNLLVRILDSWEDDEINREEFCDMFAATYEQQIIKAIDLAVAEDSVT